MLSAIQQDLLASTNLYRLGNCRTLCIEPREPCRFGSVYSRLVPDHTIQAEGAHLAYSGSYTAHAIGRGFISAFKALWFRQRAFLFG